MCIFLPKNILELHIRMVDAFTVEMREKRSRQIKLLHSHDTRSRYVFFNDSVGTKKNLQKRLFKITVKSWKPDAFHRPKRLKIVMVAFNFTRCVSPRMPHIAESVKRIEFDKKTVIRHDSTTSCILEPLFGLKLPHHQLDNLSIHRMRAIGRKMKPEAIGFRIIREIFQRIWFHVVLKSAAKRSGHSFP